MLQKLVVIRFGTSMNSWKRLCKPNRKVPIRHPPPGRLQRKRKHLVKNNSPGFLNVHPRRIAQRRMHVKNAMVTVTSVTRAEEFLLTVDHLDLARGISPVFIEAVVQHRVA